MPDSNGRDENHTGGETTGRYVLDDRDLEIVAAAIALVEKVIASTLISAAEMVSAAKLLHVLRRLPRATARVCVCFSVSGPTRRFNEHEIRHWWTINVEGSLLEVSASGYFYRKSTGGDSFTTLQWSAEPGQESSYRDYLSQHWIVDDAAPFPDEVAGIDLAEPGYTLEVTDDDNPLLGTDDGDEPA